MQVETIHDELIVNYNSQNGWTNIVDKINTPNISDSAKTTLSKISEFGSKKLKAIGKSGWSNWINKNNITDQNLTGFLKDTNESSKSLEAYQTWLSKNGIAASAFSNSLKNVAANMGIMLAFSMGIQLLATVWDNLNLTVAETQQAISNTNAEIAPLNSEYETLSARDIDTLSETEKERLAYLKERIAAEKELLAIQTTQKNEEEIGGKLTDFFDKDSYTRKLADEQFNNAAFIDLFKGGSSDNVNLLKEPGVITTALPDSLFPYSLFPSERVHIKAAPIIKFT